MTKPEQCPKCNSKEIVGVEYMNGSERYDGVSEYKCQVCNYRQGRWTGEELPEGYIESKFGEKGVVKNKESEKE